MKTILFYWSKGSDTRRKLVRLIADCERHGEACYLSFLAEKIGLSHVAIKKHVDLMVEEGYVKILNPGGKPVYLALTPKGIGMLREFSS
ncbi:MAG: winged helix-turn-helix domain-containing protein [Candidatus Micrarchaeota archaeon]